MHDWLYDACEDGAEVVTANRRLARQLGELYNRQQLQLYKSAWQSPSVTAWRDWVKRQLASVQTNAATSILISSAQSQWLWERSLIRALPGDIRNTAPLVQMARDAWLQLADWQVPIRELAASAQTQDEKLFASAAGHYVKALTDADWLDEAGMDALLLQRIKDGSIAIPKRLVFVGFNRVWPSLLAIQEAFRSVGSDVALRNSPTLANNRELITFLNEDAEWRAAGQWARTKLQENRHARIAIIVQDLQQNGSMIAHRVREGLMPGWQSGPNKNLGVLNISLGKRLVDYAAIHIAQLLLRWLVEDIDSVDVNTLIQTPLIADPALDGRSRLELVIRDLPARNWSPAKLGEVLRGRDDSPESESLLALFARASKLRRELPKKASPSQWAEHFDRALRALEWMTRHRLDSDAFQLMNRWRKLLNDFATLDLVVDSLTPAAALSRLRTLLSDTVFQPESSTAPVQLMGALEASGGRFDAMWVTGLTSDRWPSRRAPSALISRALQRQLEMPDATPADSLAYARRTLQALAASSDCLVFSFAETADGAACVSNELLNELKLPDARTGEDPGWYAKTLQSSVPMEVLQDSAPAILASEQLVGGAQIIQEQLAEPLRAFCRARLGCRPLHRQAKGITAGLRGNLLHSALHHLYSTLPDAKALRAWQTGDLKQRVDEALRSSFGSVERNADDVLRALLKLEKNRSERLIKKFIALDSEREEFSVAGVESKFEFRCNGINLALRLDRFDFVESGRVAIIDYKTGAPKKLINARNDIQDIQLFVYALAMLPEVASLAFANIGGRETSFSGVGAGYSDAEEFSNILAAGKDSVEQACKALASGDVRMNIVQTRDEARPLALLTRWNEQKIIHE